MVHEARLYNQHITHPFAGTAAALVRSFGAVQAQEYRFAKWGLGLRLGHSTVDADIEAAFTRGDILRTHVMRPTWHFVAAQDIKWLLELTAPRIFVTMASYFRKQGLDRRTLTRATGIIERTLDGGQYLTRGELGAALARRGMTFSALQLAFVAAHAELERVICSGPSRGKQITYALLSERVASARPLRIPDEPDEALAELTRRFFTRHGPATIRDFVWWSGLKASDARRGLEAIKPRRIESNGLTYWSVGDVEPGSTLSPAVHLLPVYDEYLVAYRDRAAVPYGPAIVRTTRGAVGFRHALVIDGQVAGTWRTAEKESPIAVDVTPLRKLKRAERQGIEQEVARYQRFLG